MITKEDAEQHWGRQVFTEKEAAEQLEVSVRHLRWKGDAGPPSFRLDGGAVWYPCQCLHKWRQSMDGFNMHRWRLPPPDETLH